MTIKDLLDQYGKDLPWGLSGMLQAIIRSKLPKPESPTDKSLLEYPIMVNGKAMTDLRIMVINAGRGAGFVCIATDEGSITALEHSAEMLKQDGVATSESLPRGEDTKA